MPKISLEEVRAETQRLYSAAEIGIPDFVYDEKAWSREELFEKMGGSQNDLTIFIRRKLETGGWEQVWKHGPSGRRVKAYRRKR